MNIYNLIILDESGSMSAIRHQAISSMNETIQTIKSAQKKYPGQKQFISIISFSGTGMEGVKLIGHITGPELGCALITRDGQEFELKAQGWNPLRTEQTSADTLDAES